MQTLKRWSLLALLVIWTSSVAQAATYALDPGSSVTYAASAGEGDRWSGRAPLEKLDLKLDPAKPLEAKFTVTLRPERFDTGNGIRDANARNEVFRTGAFPEITFRSSRVEGDASPLLEGQARRFKLVGKLTVTNLAREVALNAQVTRRNDKLEVQAGFGFTLSSFKLTRPQFLWIVVDDALTLNMKFTAAPQP